MNTVTASFKATVRQMTEMSQRKNKKQSRTSTSFGAVKNKSYNANLIDVDFDAQGLDCTTFWNLLCQFWTEFLCQQSRYWT